MKIVISPSEVRTSETTMPTITVETAFDDHTIHDVVELIGSALVAVGYAEGSVVDGFAGWAAERTDDDMDMFPPTSDDL